MRAWVNDKNNKACPLWWWVTVSHALKPISHKFVAKGPLSTWAQAGLLSFCCRWANKCETLFWGQMLQHRLQIAQVLREARLWELGQSRKTSCRKQVLEREHKFRLSRSGLTRAVGSPRQAGGEEAGKFGSGHCVKARPEIRFSDLKALLRSSFPHAACVLVPSPDDQ